MKLTKQEKSWAMYDWANSAFAIIMMAAVAPIYFNTLATSAGQEGDYWWSIGTSAAMVIVAVLAPLIGAIADYHGYKKKMFALFLLTGLVFTALAAVTDEWTVFLIGYGAAHIGFSGSCLVYDSFLTDITTSERMDKVSASGYALGYVGGSTIPFIVSIALIQFGDKIGLSGAAPVKISIALTVVWWGIFSIPFLKNIRQTHGIEKPNTRIADETLKNIVSTAKKIYRNKAIFSFIIAYFFYIDGVGTVINMSTAYGATLGLNTTGMILALFVTQIIAIPFSMLFSMFSKKFGSLNMLTAAVCMYLMICIVGFFMGFGLEEAWFGISTALLLFWVLAVMVGMVQGGIQALSRSYFGKMVPPENAGEFFGFFDIFGKFAAVIGPALYGFTKGVTGRSSFSILSLILLFVVALVILSAGRKYMER